MLSSFRQQGSSRLLRTACVSNHRRFSTQPKSSRSSSHQESQRLSDQARASQNLWDVLVPERNIGVTHPFFLVLLTLTLSLHYYNKHRDEEEDLRLRKRRLEQNAAESRKLDG